MRENPEDNKLQRLWSASRRKYFDLGTVKFCAKILKTTSFQRLLLASRRKYFDLGIVRSCAKTLKTTSVQRLLLASRRTYFDLGTEDRPATPATAVVVVNTRRNMAHRVMSNSITSSCSWFTCGTISAPRPGAVFGKIGKAKKCRLCFGM